MTDSRIIMDSAGDLQELEGAAFASVPLTIQTEQKEFVDNETTDVGRMVNFLQQYKGRASTACPGIGDFLEKFGEAKEVFCITITSGLSGSYNAAKIAAKTYLDEHPDRKVHVFDSLSAGPEMALLAEKVRELIHKKVPFDAIVNQVEEYRQRTHLLFSLESLHNLANNGRVPAAVAKIAGILGIRLLGKASDEGTLEPMSKVRGEAKLNGELMNSLIRMGYNGGKVRITHCFNEAAANKLRETICEKFTNADVTISAARALCSFYAERGGLLIGFEG